MHDHWNKKDVQVIEGQPVRQNITLYPDMYRPKLLSKVPSMKAINTYNNIATDNFYTYDNSSYTPESEDINCKLPSAPASFTNSYDYPSAISNHSTIANSIYMSNLDNNKGIIYTNDYDYPTLRSTTTIADNRSEVGSKKDDQGSTTRLISPNRASSSCWSWFTYAETVLCTISLAAGLGNLYRLPQTTLIRGGLPFLVAYIILSILIGLPLLFLELGLGQLSQEGFTKTWRAVPLFRGVGHVKLIAVCLVSIYYPLYIGLFGLFLIWLGKSPPPFIECASVKITKSGYKANGIPGQDCLQKTFLESPFVDPKWFGMFVGIIFLIWFLIMLLLIGRTKTYVKSLTILLFPCIGCIIALIVKVIEMEWQYKGFRKLLDDADWSLLESANIWYYAAIQVFFSTYIGFGTFVTNAGIIFSKANAFWTSFGFIILNTSLGVLSVLIWFIFTGGEDPTNKSQKTAEIHLLSLIYESGIHRLNNSAQMWILIAFSTLLLSGFISMITFSYTILKAVKVETKQRWAWWKTTVALCLIGFILGSATLLSTNFTVVHILDHYVIGNLILISVVLEVFAFIAFYGSKRIQLDFEFILGKSLSKVWITFWWIVPIALVLLFIWTMCTVSLTGIWTTDSIWVFGIGWAIVITGLIYICAIACFQIQKQDEYYNFQDKLVAVVKPSRKWGPIDPIMRYSWVQWHSKAKDGERDFTLKRRGTRDYTHSVKKRREPLNKTYVSTISVSSTLSRRSPEEYEKNDLNQNSIEIKNAVSNYNEPLRIHINSPYPIQKSQISTASDDNLQYEKSLHITPLVDSIDYSNLYSQKRSTYPTLDYKLNVNPLSLSVNAIVDSQSESLLSEGYGTYRKGPFIMPGDKGEHVCHRKFNDHELSTEL